MVVAGVGLGQTAAPEVAAADAVVVLLRAGRLSRKAAFLAAPAFAVVVA